MVDKQNLFESSPFFNWKEGEGRFMFLKSINPGKKYVMYTSLVETPQEFKTRCRDFKYLISLFNLPLRGYVTINSFNISSFLNKMTEVVGNLNYEREVAGFSFENLNEVILNDVMDTFKFDKDWVQIDVDTKDEHILNKIKDYLKNEDTIFNTYESPNGYHIFCLAPFNCKRFKLHFTSINILDNPCFLIFNESEEIAK